MRLWQDPDQFHNRGTCLFSLQSHMACFKNYNLEIVFGHLILLLKINYFVSVFQLIYLCIYIDCSLWWSWCELQTIRMKMMCIKQILTIFSCIFLYLLTNFVLLPLGKKIILEMVRNWLWLPSFYSNNNNWFIFFLQRFELTWILSYPNLLLVYIWYENNIAF